MATTADLVVSAKNCNIQKEDRGGNLRGTSLRIEIGCQSIEIQIIMCISRKKNLLTLNAPLGLAVAERWGEVKAFALPKYLIIYDLGELWVWVCLNFSFCNLTPRCGDGEQHIFCHY